MGEGGRKAAGRACLRPALKRGTVLFRHSSSNTHRRRLSPLHSTGIPRISSSHSLPSFQANLSSPASRMLVLSIQAPQNLLITHSLTTPFSHLFFPSLSTYFFFFFFSLSLSLFHARAQRTPCGTTRLFPPRQALQTYKCVVTCNLHVARTRVSTCE